MRSIHPHPHHGRLLFLSTHSFFDPRVKVGMQYIPEGLSRRGWTVDYVSVPSTPADLIGQRRRERFSRVWLKKMGRGWKINANLTEYSLPALFPPSRKSLFFDWQLKTYNWFLSRELKTRQYDICVCDCTPTSVYIPFFRFRHLILRLNDPLEWQAAPIINILKSLDRRAFTTSVWAVSRPLGKLAERLYPRLPLVVHPNGVDFDSFFRNPRWLGQTPPKRAVFVGSFESRIDQGLIANTARLLPDWTFELYGPRCYTVNIRAGNIRLHDHLPHHKIPDMLSTCSVGLIPIRVNDPDMRYLEGPLKFYEYLAAGIGIAATRAGKMEQALNGWAKFGNSPAEFAQAIIDARKSLPHDSQARRQYCRQHSWDAFLDRFGAALFQIIHPSALANRAGCS